MIHNNRTVRGLSRIRFELKPAMLLITGLVVVFVATFGSVAISVVIIVIGLARRVHPKLCDGI
jgi:hypothetical protein